MTTQPTIRDLIRARKEVEKLQRINDALLAAAKQGAALADLICTAMVNGELGHAPGCTADPCTCWVRLAPDARDALEAAIDAVGKEA